MISVITPGRQRALTAFRRYYLLKNKLSDRMIKRLLNSVIAKCRDLSVSRRSIIRLRQIIDLFATDKSRYFAQPRPITANFFAAKQSWTTLRMNVQLTIICRQLFAGHVVGFRPIRRKKNW